MNVSVATSSADPKAAAARDMQHGWEETDAGQMWSGVREDADGNLISEGGGPRSAQDLVRLRRKRLSRADYARSSRRLARDMIRYVYVVLDVSGAAHERDGALAPSRTRLDAALSVLSLFASEYYDQNPLSHLGLVAVRDGEAEMVTRLTGSKAAHAAGLARVRSDANAALASNPNSAGGVFSLQNGLEVAGRSLGHMPRYGSREILVLMGSNATCDPGDVLLETLPRLKKSGVRVSTVALAAEIHVCRMIAEKTGGIMAVCLDRTHLRDLVMGQCVPPPVRPGGGREGGSNGASGGSESGRTCEYVRMGFPSRRTEEVPTLIHAGGGGSAPPTVGRTAYVCPRCQAKAAELPTDCAVCGLKLVLAPHLARSFHHLFPVPPFEEIAEEVAVGLGGRREAVTDAPGGGNGGNTAVPDAVGSIHLPSSIFSDVAESAISLSYPAGGLLVGSGETARSVRIDATLLMSSSGSGRSCYGCLKVIGVHVDEDDVGKGGENRRKVGGRSAGGGPGPDPLRFQCPDCCNVFCADCDAYLHETLHNCPGCLCD